MKLNSSLGDRIELTSMDKFFHDISIGLYERPSTSGSLEYVVHTYSVKEGVAKRLRYLRHSMQVLGSMSLSPSEGLYFSCGDQHRLACKRLFIEACKLSNDIVCEARPLSVHDKKSSSDIFLTFQNDGLYKVGTTGEGDTAKSRVEAVANGLRKLTDMSLGERSDEVVFDCGKRHDSLIGLMLVRALNVRAVLREENRAAEQGVLSAPSAQSL